MPAAALTELLRMVPTEKEGERMEKWLRTSKGWNRQQVHMLYITADRI